MLASGFGLVRGGILGQPNIPQWYAQANGRVHFVQGCCMHTPHHVGVGWCATVQQYIWWQRQGVVVAGGIQH